MGQLQTKMVEDLQLRGNAPTTCKVEVADMVRASGDAFRATHALTPDQHAVLRDIARCRTRRARRPCRRVLGLRVHRGRLQLVPQRNVSTRMRQRVREFYE